MEGLGETRRLMEAAGEMLHKLEDGADVDVAALRRLLDTVVSRLHTVSMNLGSDWRRS